MKVFKIDILAKLLSKIQTRHCELIYKSIRIEKKITVKKIYEDIAYC